MPPKPCLAGSSDHDVVFHEIPMPIGRPIQPKRNISLFGKANWEQFKSDINDFNETFQTADQTDTNTLWNTFKAGINPLSSLHIPSKMTRSRTDIPWITASIRRKIHKRDKLYKKVKTSKGKQNYKKVKSKLFKFKSAIQKEIRKSYWEYLESVKFSNDADKCKKKKKTLYTFIKHKRSESSGVAPLKSIGTTYTYPVQQATVLNQQFESVFSKPKALSLKILAELALRFQGRTPKNVNGVPEITITNKGVEGLLKDLNPN